MPLPFDPIRHQAEIHRRTFLGRAAYGLGGAALATLLGSSRSLRAGDAVAPGQRASGATFRKPPHFPIRARRVIHLCMAGGPSHLESFDYKPELKRLHDKPFPDSFTKGQQLAQLQNTELKARGPFCEFRRWGASGQEISTLFPHIGSIADEICIIRSLHTEQINHDPAHAFMNTGTSIKGRPSMGSWLLYGLGSETENLPGFVVLTSAGKSGQQPVSARQWSSGFLPSRYQGILFQSRGEAVHYVGNPEGVCQSTQRQVVEEIGRLNGILAEERIDPEIETRIRQYEMAFRIADVMHGVALGLKKDALIFAREEAAGPLARGDRLRAGFADGGEDDEAGEILRFGAEAIQQPRAHAWPAFDGRACVHERVRGIVIDLLGVHGLDHANLVRERSDIREEAGHGQAALAVGLECHERPARFQFGVLQLRELLTFGERFRKGFAVDVFELGLVIERFEVRGTARHAEMNHAARPNGRVRGPDQGGFSAAKQRRERHAADAESGAAEERAAIDAEFEIFHQ